MERSIGKKIKNDIYLIIIMNQDYRLPGKPPLVLVHLLKNCNLNGGVNYLIFPHSSKTDTSGN